MSKRIQAKVTCPSCSFQFDFTLFRSIWGEETANRTLVMSDAINVAICPSCNARTKLNYPFIYTNAKLLFAVWWEPEYDQQIEQDRQGYIKMLGEDNYLATAPRIRDWNEFKKTILRFENGELKGKAGTLSKDMEKNMEGFLKHLKDKNKKKESSGCLVTIICLILIIGFAAYKCTNYLLS